jgi:hypothetical protein
MLSRFAKLLIVSTSFAPVIATYAFIEWLNNSFSLQFLALVSVVVLLVVICWMVLRAASSQLERFEFEVASVKSADHEIVGFVLAYLFPLISLTDNPVFGPVLIFVMAIFFIVVWTTNSYHVNPLLGIIGYHFYDVTADSNVSFLLLTRKNLRRSKTKLEVVQLTNYIVLDIND